MRKLVLLVVLAAVACAPRESKSLAQQLEGRWRLEVLGQRPLGETAISDWEIEFRRNGEWRYSGHLRMSFGASMQVGGSGRWYLRDRTLVYSAGDAHGSAVVQIEPLVLTMTPDPVLTSSARQPVETQYRRVSGF